MINTRTMIKQATDTAKIYEAIDYVVANSGGWSLVRNLILLRARARKVPDQSLVDGINRMIGERVSRDGYCGKGWRNFQVPKSDPLYGEMD